jgi:hypothetical protein
MSKKDLIELLRVPGGTRIRLQDYETGWAQSEALQELGKDVIKKRAKVIG